MTNQSNNLRPTMLRFLIAVADAVAVPIAAYSALWLHPDGMSAMPSMHYVPHLLLATMCCAAIPSFCMQNGASHGAIDASLSVGGRLVTSCLVVAFVMLMFVILRITVESSLYVMFSMLFFIASTLSHAILNAVFISARAVTTKAADPFKAKQEHESNDAYQLLGRDEIKGEVDATKAYTGRVILVTGAGGSIGSELVRQLLHSRPRKIVLFELNEGALYQVHQTMERAATGTNIEIAPVLGSVADERKVRSTLRDHKVQVVLHAAAYKHVPLVERNALAGLHNNVEGTHTLATQSVLAGVERFVLISSDKAVHPINVMGASKRLCEMVVQDISARLEGRNHPVFSIVRFGNVLGSSGSVVPLFREQMRQGGPLTITHPDVSRYFMTAKEAVHLVLQAGTMARGGEVFVLEMGNPVKIESLARRIIQSAGLSVRDHDNPTGDVQLKYVGLRTGEKLNEELTFSGKWSDTAHPRIFTAIEDQFGPLEVAAALRALRHALANDDEDGARENACRWVEKPREGAAAVSQLLEHANGVDFGLYVSSRSQSS